MSDLVEWLLACIAEDETLARAASHYGERWIVPTVHGPVVTIDDGTEFGGEPVVYDEGRPTDEQAAHIAHNDPAHVLAACKAHRAIVETFVETYSTRMALDEIYGDPEIDSVMRPLYDLIDALALAYADRPGFREEWRP